jgi:hypothetical protein
MQEIARDKKPIDLYCAMVIIVRRKDFNNFNQQASQ